MSKDFTPLTDAEVEAVLNLFTHYPVNSEVVASLCKTIQHERRQLSNLRNKTMVAPACVLHIEKITTLQKELQALQEEMQQMLRSQEVFHVGGGMERIRALEEENARLKILNTKRQ